MRGNSNGRHARSQMNSPYTFQLSIETNHRTGEVMATYFQVRKGRAVVTKEFADGAAFADYNRKGELLGIEMLAPCKVGVVDKIAQKREVKKFIRDNAPRRMLVGAG